MTPKRVYPVRSIRWREMVEYRLQHGYGIEDIAIQMQCQAQAVREYVADLRERGTLAKWWPRRAN